MSCNPLLGSIFYQLTTPFTISHHTSTALLATILSSNHLVAQKKFEIRKYVAYCNAEVICTVNRCTIKDSIHFFSVVLIFQHAAVAPVWKTPSDMCKLQLKVILVLMAFDRNGYFQISKNMEFFIKWDNFLKKVDTESVLYTCHVVNKGSIFSSLILVFVKHCGC